LKEGVPKQFLNNSKLVDELKEQNEIASRISEQKTV
jgi:hypothetical protein